MGATDCAMKRMLRILIYIGFMFSLSGCQTTDLYLNYLLGEDINQIPTFMDDFSNHQNGWKVFVTDTGIVHYDQDSFRIMILEDNADYWTTPGLTLKDTVTDVDAIKLTGPGDNLYGLVCRWQNPNNYYAFQVSSDGYYGIIRVKEGVRQVISDVNLQTSPVIQQGTDVNHLRVDCVGDQLTFYVNWEQVASVQDDSFTQGDVGMIASTLKKSGTDVRFDNFIVITP